MSVCIQQHHYGIHSQNKSQQLPARDALLQLPQNFCVATENTPKQLKKSILRVWIARHRQRKQLSELDARLLQDIGCTREEAKAEFTKYFWD